MAFRHGRRLRLQGNHRISGLHPPRSRLTQSIHVHPCLDRKIMAHNRRMQGEVAASSRAFDALWKKVGSSSKVPVFNVFCLVLLDGLLRKYLFCDSMLAFLNGT